MHSSRMHTARSSSDGGGSASVHAGIHPLGVGLAPPPGVGLETLKVWAWRPPQVWACRPPGCGPEDTPRCGPGDPPWPDPSTSPLGVGLETCKACWDSTPRRPAARQHAGIPPAMCAGIPPPPHPWTE